MANETQHDPETLRFAAGITAQKRENDQLRQEVLLLKTELGTSRLETTAAREEVAQLNARCEQLSDERDYYMRVSNQLVTTLNNSALLLSKGVEEAQTVSHRAIQRPVVEGISSRVEALSSRLPASNGAGQPEGH